LREAGIQTLADLKRVGVVEAWQRCALGGHPVSLILAYALEGALRGLDWRELPKADRDRLREAIRAAEESD
jgi:DNA transformation protein